MQGIYKTEYMTRFPREVTDNFFICGTIYYTTA